LSGRFPALFLPPITLEKGKAKPMDELDEIRKQIDEVNNMIVGLLNHRQALVHKAFMYKRDHGLELRDRERETQMLERVLANNTGPLTYETLTDIFQAIFKHTLDMFGEDYAEK
jgi:chorismate mutase